MKRFVLQRLWQSLFVIFGVVTIVFFIVYLIGDPVLTLLPPEASYEDQQVLRAAMGLDRPLLVQYGRFLAQVAQGDLGRSFRHGVPALSLTLGRIPATLELTGVAIVFALLMGIPIGIYSAVRRNSFLDHFGRIFALFGISMPVYWSGLMLIMLFGVRWNLLPPSGRGTWQHLILPGFTMGLFATAPIMRLIRSSMLDVLNKDYIRTATAKGLTHSVVILKHALRNAAIPTLTVFGMQVGLLLGGAVLTETVFSWPGMGRFVVQAVYNRDFPVIRSAVIVFAVIIVTINFLTDLAYGLLDPKIRYE